MNTLPSIALSGLQAAQAALHAAAHNIANAQTEGFHRQELQQHERQGGGVDWDLRRATQEGSSLETDLVDQLRARHGYMANLAVFRTADRIAGALLDVRA